MIQHERLLEKALALGIEVVDCSAQLQTPAALLKQHDRQELIIKGVPGAWVSHSSMAYCDNKQLTKTVFEALGIPYLKSIIFSSTNEPAVSDFFENGRAYVCKPLDDSDGRGVQMDIRSISMVQDYLMQQRGTHSRFLMEEQGQGQDLRLQVIGGKIVAACIREPAYVTGDGRHSLTDLIEERRAIMLRQNPANQLELDQITQQLIATQGLSLEAVPAAGQKVRLKQISNMSKGGRALDVTDEIHPQYQVWATALSAFLKSGYLGLDFLTTDHRAAPEAHSFILEVNARAEWLHHTFSDRRTHDIPAMILEELFSF